MLSCSYRVFGLAKIRRKGKWPYRLQISTPAPPWGTLTKRVDFGRPVLPAPPPTTAEKKNDISECHLVLLYLGFFSPKFSTFLSLLHSLPNRRLAGGQAAWQFPLPWETTPLFRRPKLTDLRLPPYGGELLR